MNDGGRAMPAQTCNYDGMKTGWDGVKKDRDERKVDVRMCACSCLCVWGMSCHAMPCDAMRCKCRENSKCTENKKKDENGDRKMIRVIFSFHFIIHQLFLPPIYFYIRGVFNLFQLLKASQVHILLQQRNDIWVESLPVRVVEMVLLGRFLLVALDDAEVLGIVDGLHDVPADGLLVLGVNLASLEELCVEFLDALRVGLCAHVCTRKREEKKENKSENGLKNQKKRENIDLRTTIV